MAIVSSIRRVNEADISRAPRAERDIYIPATDASGTPIGYGRQLIARAGQPIPARYREHPAVKGAAVAPVVVPDAAVRIPAGDPRPVAVSTMTKPDLIDELGELGVELEGGETVPQLREKLKAARDGVTEDDGAGDGDDGEGDDEDAVGDDGAGDEEE